MSTISEVVDNYAIFAIATFIACVLVALIVKRLSGSAHKTVTPAPVSEREGNRAGSSEEGGGDGDGEHDRNKQTYMELFASKIYRNNTKASTPHERRRYISPDIFPPSTSIKQRTSSPSRMTSPGDEFTDSSSVSTFRVAKKLFGGTRSTDQGSLTSERSSIDKSTPGSTYDKTSPAALMHESAHNPHVLIGCRIYINGKGQGTIIGMRKRKFSSSKFRISFDSNPSESVELKLRRRAGRSGEDFQILPRNS